MLNMIVNEILKYPDALHCFCALSYRQMKDASMPLFEMLCEQMGIQFTPNKSDASYNVGKTKIIFRSLDACDKMRSVEIGSLAIEEFSYGDAYAVKVFIGRLRDKKGSLRLRTAFTPKGYNFAYKFWIEDNKEYRHLVQMSTFDNKHLPEEYIQSIIDSYDSELQKQELYGEFLELGKNKVYYMFNRRVHVQEFEFEPAEYFGMDFNVNPLTGVACFIRDGILYVQDEMFLRNSNTYEATSYILKNFGKVQVIPDSTGGARKTSSVKSDFEILKEGGLKVIVTRNPPIKDRYNAVNNLLDKGLMIIHPRCKNLINDLEKLQDPNTDADLSHISDSLGYVVWKHFALKKKIDSNKEMQFIE
jgi:hypothetical protein